MNEQISMDDLLRAEEEPRKVVIPTSRYDGEKIYTIPDDVWEKRCRFCVQKNGPENIQIPIWAVHKAQYEKIIPCKIMAISHPNKMPGECMNFAPKITTYGICATCKHNGPEFHEGFCFKEDHAEQRRVCYGQRYGGDERKIDYYARHRLSVCDDYEPHEYVDERERINERTQEAADPGQAAADL